MTFELDYPDLLQFAADMCRNYNSGSQAEEILSETFLALHAVPYQKSLFKKEIVKTIFRLKGETINFRELGDVQKSPKSEVLHFCCKRCLEVLPESEYYVNRRKSGKPVRATECKKCFSKRQTLLCQKRIRGISSKTPVGVEYLLTIPVTEKAKTELKERTLKSLNKSPDRRKSYYAERYKLGKELLTDFYISQVLRQKHKVPQKDITPEKIERFRFDLLNK